jgi:hypothetical protein
MLATRQSSPSETNAAGRCIECECQNLCMITHALKLWLASWPSPWQRSRSSQHGWQKTSSAGSRQLSPEEEALQQALEQHVCMLAGTAKEVETDLVVQ